MILSLKKRTYNDIATSKTRRGRALKGARCYVFKLLYLVGFLPGGLARLLQAPGLPPRTHARLSHNNYHATNATYLFAAKPSCQKNRMHSSCCWTS
ncbi:hypothetical protein V8E53_006367 [Lactarius tabidus]